jgi:hypothetical protein
MKAIKRIFKRIIELYIKFDKFMEPFGKDASGAISK